MSEAMRDPAMRDIVKALGRWGITPQEVDQWLSGMDHTLGDEPVAPQQTPVQPPVQQVQPEPLRREEPSAPKEPVPLPDLAVRALDAVSKVALGSQFAEAGKFNDLMRDAVSKCPELAAHIGNTLGDPMVATVRFSETAKDCFWSKTGDRLKGVPDRTVTMPSKEKTPIDLLDGLIFETCNVEIQPDYDTLNRDLFARLRTPTPENPPLTLCDYGMAKAKIESKAVLKHAQLLQKSRESGVELSHQSHRNLLAMLKTCKERSGGTVENYDSLLDDEEGIVSYLSENEEELGKFLGDADTDEKIRDAILNAMASSPHNRNAGPADKNSLNSNDLYAYDLLELMTAPQLVTMVVEEIKKHVALSNDVLKTLRQAIQRRVGSYDVSGGEAVDRSARNAVVLRVIADLKQFIPALAEATFPTLGFSDAMRDMAAKREAGLSETLAADIEVARKNLEAVQRAKAEGTQLPKELAELGEKLGEKTKAEIAVETALDRLRQYDEGKAKEEKAVEEMRNLLVT